MRTATPTARAAWPTRRAALTLALALALLGSGAPRRLLAQSVRVPYTTFTLPNGLKVIVH